MPGFVGMFTSSVLHEPLGNERIAPFLARVPTVYEAAERAAGFVCHVRTKPTLDDSGRPLRVDYDAVPAWHPVSSLVVQTLSVWRDVASVRAYVYSGGHLEALRKRADWITETSYPQYVLWWRSSSEPPLHSEGVKKLQLLHANGSSPHAFTFAQRYDSMGNLVQSE